MPRGPDFQKERGEKQRRRILEQLKAGPMSAQELADTIYLSRAAVLLHIQVLRAAKLVRIADHRTQCRSREIRLYGLGDAPDAEYVKVKRRGVGVLEQQRRQMRQAIIDQLKISRATSTELAVLLKVSEPTMRKYLPMMHAEKLVYRAGWVAREGGGEPVAVWGHGNFRDQPVPKVIHPRGTPRLPEEQLEMLRKSREAKEIVRMAISKPQNIFSALGL
ncbi:MAG TPA: winged helix-turn-helix domain-containing protein [Oxalicibacterium sp.]|nr:winged helix-turn-helix domain-containing protein [Oxalicibacterium sp.]